MTVLTRQIKLRRDSLTEGGFAGLREHRLVKSPRAFGESANNDGSWLGMGDFVYLADARFMPYGETHMHSHHEVDVISVMVEGNIAHKGSMGHGEDLKINDVQVQRAGGEGFSHNEVNPDGDWNRMIQLWVLPEESGEPASYKVYQPEHGESTRIYGGFGDNDAFLHIPRLMWLCSKKMKALNLTVNLLPILHEAKDMRTMRKLSMET